MISLLYFGQPGIFVVSMHLIPHLYARLYKFLCFVQMSMEIRPEPDQDDQLAAIDRELVAGAAAAGAEAQ